jgi:GntR family transcriptional regulator
MLPFPILIQPGESPVKQVVFAASKAILAGGMRPGDPFPSVRELSEELKLHPNTVQKVIAELVRDGFLAVRTGVGTVVTAGPRAPDPDRRSLLGASIEQLVVEARRVGLGSDELLAAVDSTWRSVFGDDRRTGTHDAGSPRTRAASRGQRR